MWRYIDIIPEYQLKTPQIVRMRVLNVVGDLIDNHKLKDFVLEQNLIPLTDIEICEEMCKYSKQVTSMSGYTANMFSYLGNVIGYKEMEEILKKFRKLVIEIEPLTYQHEDKGE